MQAYSDPRRTSDPHALPDIEVFHATGGELGRDDDGNPLPAGWYWCMCFPGCLPDSNPIGPFDTEEEALADARDDYDDDPDDDPDDDADDDADDDPDDDPEPEPCHPLSRPDAPEWAKRIAEQLPDPPTFPAFVFPGGYAVAYVTSDGAMLCAGCCNNPNNPIHFDTSPAGSDGWALAGYQTADWHDIGEGDWTCDNCNAVIDPEPEP